MVLKIMAFGIAKDILGASKKNFTVDDKTTVKQLKNQLTEEYPDFVKLGNFMIAINSNYAKGTEVIKKSDEVAIIPPTSGG